MHLWPPLCEGHGARALHARRQLIEGTAAYGRKGEAFTRGNVRVFSSAQVVLRGAILFSNWARRAFPPIFPSI